MSKGLVLFVAAIGVAAALIVTSGQECASVTQSTVCGTQSTTWQQSLVECDKYIQSAGNFSVRRCINAQLNQSTIVCSDIAGATSTSACLPKKAVCDAYKDICGYSNDSTAFNSENTCQTYYDTNNGVVKTCMDAHISFAVGSVASKNLHCPHAAGMLCAPKISRSFAVVLKNIPNNVTEGQVREGLAKELMWQLAAADFGSNTFESEGGPNAAFTELTLTGNNNTKVLNITVRGPDGSSGSTPWFDLYFPTQKLFSLTSLMAGGQTITVNVSRLCPYRGKPVQGAPEGRMSFCEPINCGCPKMADPNCDKVVSMVDSTLPLLNYSSCMMGKIPQGLLGRTSDNNGKSQDNMCLNVNLADCMPEALFAKYLQTRCALNSTFGTASNASNVFKGFKLSQQLCMYNAIKSGVCGDATGEGNCKTMVKNVYLQVAKLGGGVVTLADFNATIASLLSGKPGIPFDLSEISSITTTSTPGTFLISVNAPSNVDFSTQLNAALAGIPGYTVAVSSTPPVPIVPSKSAPSLSSSIAALLTVFAAFMANRM